MNFFMKNIKFKKEKKENTKGVDKERDDKLLL